MIEPRWGSQLAAAPELQLFLAAVRGLTRPTFVTARQSLALPDMLPK
jgi:hypothetical protein